ncbi:MAG: type II toxin-antitoxin system VapC family toxin [Terracidiphilus sp.]
MSSTTTSLDSNVLVYLLNQDSLLNLRALAAIEQARKRGLLVVSGPVYAELLGLPSRTQAILDEFFTIGGIQVDWRFDESAWRAAGVAFQGYVERRLADTGLLPRRILTDFLIGAHALVCGYALLTTDSSHYAAAFPELQIIAV